MRVPSILKVCAQVIRQVRSAYILRRPNVALRLHLGCGGFRLPGFVNVDYNAGSAVDYVCNIAHLPCPQNSVARIETYHVIEHLAHPTVRSILSHWHKILSPDGVLVIECPDFDADVAEYLSGNEGRLGSIFGLQRFHGDAHLYGYNRKRLSELLASVGFVDVVHCPPQDYHAASEPCLRVECRKTGS